MIETMMLGQFPGSNFRLTFLEWLLGMFIVFTLISLIIAIRRLVHRSDSPRHRAIRQS